MSAVDGLLLDIDGVLTVSWRPIEGAPETLARLRGEGIPFRLVTNTTSRSRASLAATLREAGFDVAGDDLVTAPAATAAHLRSNHPGARCLLLAKGDVAEDLEGVELVEEAPEVVVVAGTDAGPGPEEVFTYENLNRAFRALMEGAALVAMHRNLSWRTDEGLALDSGAFTLGLEAAAAVTAEVVGKPAPDFFRQAVALLGVPAERAAMVGDDVVSDVLAAQAVGLTGVLVRTGKFREEDLARAEGRPDHVVDSVADLPALLRRIHSG